MTALWSLLVGLVALFSFSLAQEVVIYSGRSERLVKPVLDEFSKRTGIRYVLHSAGTVELYNKLLAEGDRSPADLFLTVDGGTLERARIAGLLQPIRSELVTQKVPSQMRAPDNSWVGVSLRFRVIAYNPKKVKPQEVRDFESLMNLKWKGRLGIRTGSNVYPQSHTAMMIAEKGEAYTERFLRAIVANAGDKIYPSDARIVEAIARGEIDVGIVNHYYVHLHLKKNPNDKENLAFVAPSGTAYNVSGVGLLKTSRNREAAIKLIEFLVSDEGQRLFAEENMEYPVNPKVPVPKDMIPRDKLKLSKVSIHTMGLYMITAMDLIDKVGYR
ncbi:MAG: extracellular solute-binding protein [Acidobacteria bacterium]|jgi:iron(III) transport system substrate-binding protein|nr:MAG: extracellular solute-binding protein [Acidobacteriota bacterium]